VFVLTLWLVTLIIAVQICTFCHINNESSTNMKNHQKLPVRVLLKHKNHGQIKISIKKITTNHTTTTTVLGPFVWDYLGEPVPEENFWTSWCNRRLTEADTSTILLGATPSGLTSAHLHHPPCPSCRSTNSVKALKATSTLGLGRRCYLRHLQTSKKKIMTKFRRKCQIRCINSCQNFNQ